MSTIRDVKSIEFQFENCEGFSVDAKYIGTFWIGDIRRQVSRIACNVICDMNVAHEFYAEIYKEGDGEYATWGDPMNKFNRILAYDDITSITLKYDDGTEEEYYLNYDEGKDEGILGADNINQSSKKSNLGNLYIVVDDTKIVDCIFPDDETEDEDAVDFAKEMIGVNDPEPFTNNEE